MNNAKSIALKKNKAIFDYGNSLIEILNPQPFERILDLGCGTGELTKEIAPKSETVIGLDISSELIDAAKQSYPEIEFLQGNPADFNFETPFDAVFSNAALHWISDAKGAIKSVYKNLKPGGRFVAEFGGKGNVNYIFQKIEEEVNNRYYSAEIAPWYFPSIGEYTSELESAGFRVSMARHYDRPIKLVDGEQGIKNWIAMFSNIFFDGIPENVQNEIAEKVATDLKPTLFKNGDWYVDYKRILVEAWKD